MMEECKKRGGNAVLGVKMDTAGIQSFYKIAAYGSACIVETTGPDLLL